MSEPTRRTKIVATVGPASDSPDMIRRLIEAGVNVVRLNFSHGTQQSHGEAIGRIRAAASELDMPIAVLQDLQGPRIRIGELANHEPVELTAGARVRITTEPVAGTAECVSTTYASLPDDVRPGDAVLLDLSLIHI